MLLSFVSKATVSDQLYVQSLVFPGPAKGALTQLRAGTDPEAAKWNGQVCGCLCLISCVED